MTDTPSGATQVAVPYRAVQGAVEKIHDLLIMLGLDPDERDEDGIDSRTTAEVVAAAALNGGANEIALIELARFAQMFTVEMDGSDGGYCDGMSTAVDALHRRIRKLRGDA